MVHDPTNHLLSLVRQCNTFTLIWSAFSTVCSHTSDREKATSPVLRAVAQCPDGALAELELGLPHRADVPAGRRIEVLVTSVRRRSLKVDHHV